MIHLVKIYYVTYWEGALKQVIILTAWYRVPLEK
jgi:hypothetical protein